MQNSLSMREDAHGYYYAEWKCGDMLRCIEGVYAKCSQKDADLEVLSVIESHGVGKILYYVIDMEGGNPISIPVERVIENSPASYIYAKDYYLKANRMNMYRMRTAMPA